MLFARVRGKIKQQVLLQLFLDVGENKRSLQRTEGEGFVVVSTNVTETVFYLNLNNILRNYSFVIF